MELEDWLLCLFFHFLCWFLCIIRIFAGIGLRIKGFLSRDREGAVKMASLEVQVWCRLLGLERIVGGIGLGCVVILRCIRGFPTNIDSLKRLKLIMPLW